MNKIIALTLVAALSPLATLAQDDMYFVPTKENVEKSAAHYGMPRETYYSGSNRSVDEYNRRIRSTVEPLDSAGNDIIHFDAAEGQYPDSIAGGDFECTRKMSRFDDYTPDDDAYWRGYYAGRAGRWSWGWYDPWYYGSYYSWYDPWYYSSYYGWYDPWYYGWGYYRPWHYYGGWYGRPWYGGGGGHYVAHRGGNAGWGNRYSTSSFRGNRNSVGYGHRRSSSSQSWSNTQRSNTFNSSRSSNFGSNRSSSFNSSRSSNFGSNRSSSFGSNRSGGSFGGGSRGGFGGGGGSRGGGGFGGRR